MQIVHSLCNLMLLNKLRVSIKSTQRINTTFNVIEKTTKR